MSDFPKATTGMRQDQDLNLGLTDFILQPNSSQRKPRSRSSWQQGGSGCGQGTLSLHPSQAGHSLDSEQSPGRWGQDRGGYIEATELLLTKPLLGALHANIVVSFNPHTLPRTRPRACLLHRRESSERPGHLSQPVPG